MRIDHHHDRSNDINHYPSILHAELLYHCANYVNAPRINIHEHPERADHIDDLARNVYDAAAAIVNHNHDDRTYYERHLVDDNEPCYVNNLRADYINKHPGDVLERARNNYHDTQFLYFTAPHNDNDDNDRWSNFERARDVYHTALTAAPSNEVTP